MRKPYETYNSFAPTEKMKYPFRFGKARKPSERRIKKWGGKHMTEYNVMYGYITIPVCFPGSVSMFRFFHHVIWHFFMPQYFQKIHLRHTPVKHVDHQLDEKVPFREDMVSCYMDFINVWVRPLSMLMHRFNIFQGAKLSCEWFRYLCLAYHESYRMYSYSMTTTYRPKPETKKVKALYASDPHYMCVPSLHISIVCLCFSFYRMLFKREYFTQEEIEMWNKELFERAVDIGETVLYIKQHSVNCIPAALYMITRIFPELFTPETATEFISALFKTKTDVSDTDRKKIQAHILFTYERFLLEGAIEEDWRDPIIRWLGSYQSHVPFYADIENKETESGEK